MHQIIFDVETKKTFEEVGGYFPEKLEISFVGLCVREHEYDPGKFIGFFENELDKLFPLLEQTDVVIGFNSDGFDLPALQPYYSGNISSFPSLDLLSRFKDITGHRIKLDSIAQETLGIGKSGNGLDAIKYYREGDFESLKKYCLQDVKITRDIYDYGLRKGTLKYKNKWNRLIETPIDFNFQPTAQAGIQMALI